MATNLTINVCLALYYVFVAKYNPVLLPILTIIVHAFTLLSIGVLAFVDPGILKKKYIHY